MKFIPNIHAFNQWIKCIAFYVLAMIAASAFFQDKALGGTFECSQKTVVELLNDVSHNTLSSAQPLTWVQPGGETSDIVFDRELAGASAVRACAAIIWNEQKFRMENGLAEPGVDPPVDILDECRRDSKGTAAERVSVLSLTEQTSKDNAGKEIVARIFVPQVEALAWCDARILVGLYDSNGEHKILAGFNRVEWVSSKHFAMWLTGIWFALAYVGVAIVVHFARQRALRQLGNDGEASKWTLVRIFDPLQITAGANGRTSVSILQVFGFTILVGMMLLYILARIGSLSELSTHVLLLLGISAGGAGLSKLADSGRRRLSLENWAWLRNKKCLSDSTNTPKWGELFVTDGNFDITKFQILTFSLIVACAMVGQGFDSLENFQIPESLLGILGLSQAIYVAGKMGPASVSEYNTKLNVLRDTEKTFRTAVAIAVSGDKDKEPTSLPEAMKLAPGEYELYAAHVDEAAVMHRSVFGEKDVKEKLRTADYSASRVEPAKDLSKELPLT